jgi:nucleoside-triphosphatase THEP1
MGLTSPSSDTQAAAIGHEGGADADALLARIVAELRGAGRRVQGLLMRHEGGQAGDTACGVQMFLVDVSTDERYLVSQPMGSLSKSCRADPQGFARATVVLRRALEERPDLVVLNRFGRLEAEGGGMRAELLALMAEGVPVLTAVAPAHRAAWDAFSGGAPVLASEPDAVQAWLAALLEKPIHLA